MFLAQKCLKVDKFKGKFWYMSKHYRVLAITSIELLEVLSERYGKVVVTGYTSQLPHNAFTKPMEIAALYQVFYSLVFSMICSPIMLDFLHFLWRRTCFVNIVYLNTNLCRHYIRHRFMSLDFLWWCQFRWLIR